MHYKPKKKPSKFMHRAFIFRYVHSICLHFRISVTLGLALFQFWNWWMCLELHWNVALNIKKSGFFIKGWSCVDVKPLWDPFTHVKLQIIIHRICTRNFIEAQLNDWGEWRDIKFFECVDKVSKTARLSYAELLQYPALLDDSEGDTSCSQLVDVGTARNYF
jgi:hypothetical protein